MGGAAERPGAGLPSAPKSHRCPASPSTAQIGWPLTSSTDAAPEPAGTTSSRRHA